jgi:hypothetical protein
MEISDKDFNIIVNNADLYRGTIAKSVSEYILSKIIAIGKYLDWTAISKRNNLSFEFVEKHMSKLRLYELFKYNQFTEEQIEILIPLSVDNTMTKYGGRWSIWFAICNSQDISLDFVKAHLNEIKYEYFKNNRRLGRSNKAKIRAFFKQYSDLL